MRARKAFALLLVGLLMASVAYAAVGRRAFIIFSGAATDTTAVGMADSSAVFYTGDCQRLFLQLHPNKPCRVAIQVRSHGDSLTGASVPGLADSSKVFSWPWRAFVGAATTLNNVSDSTVWKEVTAPTSVLAGEDEMVVEFGDLDASSAMKWWGVRGKTIALAKLDNGEFYWGPNTSIRLRVLTAGGVVTWRANLQGVAY